MPEPASVNIARDLLIIHRIATRSIQVSLDHSQRFAQSDFPDSTTREGYYNYVRSLSTLLTSHHTGEDQIAFPEIKLRIPASPVDQLCAEHEEMQAILDRINHLLEGASSGNSDLETLAGLEAELDQLSALWGKHIPIEEEVMTAKQIRAVFKDYEEGELSRKVSEHGINTSKPDYLLLPFMLYNLSPEDRARWEQLLPAVVVQQLIPVVWKDKWESMRPFLLV